MRTADAPRSGTGGGLAAGWGPAAEWGLATGTVVVAGVGAVLVVAGWGAGDPGLLVLGGLLLAGGLGVLLTMGWVAGLPLLALVLLLPAPYTTESLRLSAAAGLTAVVVLAWLLRRGGRREDIRVRSFPRRSAAALLAAVVLSAVLARSPLPAVQEVVTFVLLLGLLAAATDELAGAPGFAAARLARVLAGVAGVAGLLAALEALGILPGRFPLPGTRFYRATLGLGWPNELGMFFAITLPLVVYVCRTARSATGSVLAWTWLAGALLGLAATFSRGSWLAAPAGAAALFLAGEGRLVLRFWAVGLVGALAVDLASGGALSARIAGLAGDWVVEQRAALLVTGLLMFQESPLVGIGPGGFGEHLERFGVQVSALWDYVGSAHNSYVHMAAETGVIGLAAFLSLGVALFLVLLRGARRARTDPRVPAHQRELRLALLWSFGTVAVLGMLEWLMAHGVGQLVVLVAAMGLALEEESGDGG